MPFDALALILVEGHVESLHSLLCADHAERDVDPVSSC